MAPLRFAIDPRASYVQYRLPSSSRCSVIKMPLASDLTWLPARSKRVLCGPPKNSARSARLAWCGQNMAAFPPKAVNLLVSCSTRSGKSAGSLVTLSEASTCADCSPSVARITSCSRIFFLTAAAASLPCCSINTAIAFSRVLRARFCFAWMPTSSDSRRFVSSGFSSTVARIAAVRCAELLSNSPSLANSSVSRSSAGT
jgi:hypothetical protein